MWDVDENWDPEELTNFLRSPSLFREKKVFVLKNLFSKKAEDVIDILKSQNQESRDDIFGLLTSFLSKEECVKKDPTLWKFLNQKSVKTEEINPLRGSALIKWAEGRVNSAGLGISDSALKKLSKIINFI